MANCNFWLGHKLQNHTFSSIPSSRLIPRSFPFRGTNSRVCAIKRYLQQILSSEQEPTDDAWVTKAVQEAMMHKHSSESEPSRYPRVWLLDVLSSWVCLSLTSVGAFQLAGWKAALEGLVSIAML
eukprot:5760110-Pleurochrysis_carterae.AAC.1